MWCLVAIILKISKTGICWYLVILLFLKIKLIEITSSRCFIIYLWITYICILNIHLILVSNLLTSYLFYLPIFLKNKLWWLSYCIVSSCILGNYTIIIFIQLNIYLGKLLLKVCRLSFLLLIFILLISIS